MTTSSGWNPPQVNDLGLSRYDEIVLYAEKRGITVAFENLRMVGNLAYLIDRYEHCDNVRFCFDCGHEHCYTKTVSMIDVFTNRICCTHIHDNMGKEDEHLIPGDGIIDWDSFAAALKDIKEIQMLKSDLDKQEQEARIEKLRREAERNDDKDLPSLNIVGLPEEFKK